MPDSPKWHAYYVPPATSFWQWQDESAVVTWSDGVSITFRAELEVVLARLAPQGFPSLSAVLLVLAACRSSWFQPPSRRGLLHRLLTSLDPTPFLEYDTLFDGLDKVHTLSKELCPTTEARAELVAMLFEDRQRLSVEISGQLLEVFKRRHENDTLMRLEEIRSEWLYGAHALSVALTRLTRESLASRLRTGLDQPLKPAPIEAPPGGAVRELIRALLNDQELGGLARLAKQLLALVQMPRALSDPDELPLGGVSDITNRGTLDRLLLTELAHDDETLAVRVAVNEALYLRRESPPRRPPHQRLVLLDSGVRTWGVPRVFISAVGLALSATTEARIHAHAFRAEGRGAAAIDMHTAQGLTDHLAALRHESHPGAALDSMLAIAAAEAGAELVIVTTDDAVADRGFQLALEQADTDKLYLASVTREGRFRLLERGRGGTKLLREARLSLDDILSPTAKPQAPLIDPLTPEALPAIFGVQPFPLRLSYTINPQTAWHVRGWGVLSLRDGRLLTWEHPTRGGRELAVGLPQGAVQSASGEVCDGKTVAIVGRLTPQRLFSLLVDTNSGSVVCQQLDLGDERPLASFGHHGILFVRTANTVFAFSDTGHRLATRTLPKTASWIDPPRMQGGRYFIDGSDWWAVAFDGSAIQFEKLPLQSNWFLSYRVLDVHGVEGGVFVDQRGGIGFLNGAPKKSVVATDKNDQYVITGRSRDGLRILLDRTSAVRTSKDSLLLYTISATKRAAGPQPELDLEPHLAEFARPRVLRSKFSGIGIYQDELVLVARKGRRHALRLSEGTIRLVSSETTSSLDYQLFKSLDERAAPGYSLGVVNWPDGSSATLDGRGLLHLHSSDPTIAQTTVVLDDREVALWCADGRWCGPKYFVGDDVGDPENAGQLFRDTITRFVQWVRATPAERTP